MTWLSLEQAAAATLAARRRAEEIGIRVTVAVVDDGGHLIHLSRMDGAAALTPEIAEAKASGAAALGRPGDAVAEIYEKRPGFFEAVAELTRRPLVPGLGSVLIRREERIIGAIGVSGGRPAQDLDCAEAGLKVITGL
ncbi:MAG: heme-binding protein [Candidatus Dormibacteraeota bacterium]|nr:heme-binding protein [Candidatus Dormibacteraeota bacterium]